MKEDRNNYSKKNLEHALQHAHALAEELLPRADPVTGEEIPSKYDENQLTRLLHRLVNAVSLNPNPGLLSHRRFSRWIKNKAKGKPQEDTIELSMIDEIKEQRRRELAKKTRACEEVVTCRLHELQRANPNPTYP